MNKKAKQHVEHYAYAVVVAGVAIWQTGNHDLGKVAYAAVVAVLGPVLKTGYDKVKTKIK